MMSETYENFMIFGLESTGEKIKLDISEDTFRLNNGQKALDPNQVLIIVKEGIRRIYIWKGVNSHVRKKFIASRVAAELQNNLVVAGHFHRCKIISVDQGDEPKDFLRAFGFTTVELPEFLDHKSPEFKQIHSISAKTERELGGKKVHSWKGPPPSINGKKASPTITQPETKKTKEEPKKTIKFSKTDKMEIIKKIVKNNVPVDLKRQNLILGNFQIFGVAIKKAKIFGEEVEEVEWEPVNSLPEGIIELTDRTLRIYVNHASKTIEGIEILQKLEALKVVETTIEKDKEADYNTWTVKQLRIFCQENNIKVPASYRKSQIINLVNKGPSQESIEPESNYKTWTVKQLKEYCKKNDIYLLSTYKKADLLKLVEDHQK
jgi:hypothetical protein